MKGTEKNIVPASFAMWFLNFPINWMSVRQFVKVKSMLFDHERLPLKKHAIESALSANLGLKLTLWRTK